ncbi:MAG TPA: hypothetical protein VHC00_20220 [Rhizobiaceae bacterium]|nr:hypothetical protein [Rhizobiaceae bacterium]
MSAKMVSLASLLILFYGMDQAYALPVPEKSPSQYDTAAGTVRRLVALPDFRVRKYSWLFTIKKMQSMGLLDSDQVNYMHHCFWGNTIKPCMKHIGYCRVGPVPEDRLPVHSLMVFDNPFMILLKTGPDQLSGRVPKHAALMTSWEPCR